MAVNLTVSRSGAPVEIARNLCTNPSFEATSGTVEVRRNLFPSPRPTSSQGTFVNCSFSTGTGDGPPPAPSQYWRGTCTASNSSSGVDTTVNATTTTTGVKTVSAWVRSSVAHSVNLTPIAGGSTGVTVVSQPTVVLTANVWTRVYYTGNFPNTGAVGVRIRNVGAVTMPIGATFDIGAILVEEVSSLQSFFDGTTPPKLRRNLAKNTCGGGGTTGWSAGVPGLTTTLSAVSGGPFSTFVRASITAGTASGDGSITLGTNSSTRADIRGGITYIPSLQVNISRPGVIAYVDVICRDSAGTVLLDTSQSQVTLGSGWTTVAGLSFVAPATSAYAEVRLVLRTSGAVLTSGDTVDITGTLLEEGTVVDLFFDGSNPLTPYAAAWEGTANASASYLYDPDLTPSWTSTTNASASILTAVKPASFAGTPGTGYSSTNWSIKGSRSVVVDNKHATGSSYAEFSLSASYPGGISAMLGKTFTAVATMRSTGPVSMPVSSNARSLGARFYGSATVLAFSDYPVGDLSQLRITFTVPADSTSVAVRMCGLHSSDTNPDGRVWWDDLLIIEGEYDGNYFDGDTPDNARYTYAWLGTANASVSTLSSLVVGDYEVVDYSVDEDSSPLSVLDSSGGVGTVSLTLGVPEDPNNPIRKYSSNWLRGKNFTLVDDRYGTLSGTLDSVERSTPTTVSVTGLSRLGDLNIYNVQAQPYVGTLGGAFAYYLGLAGITTGYSVDASITARTVNYVGWNGELWYHLKMMASAQQCDITLLNDIITLRPSRTQTVVTDYLTDNGYSVGGGDTAQSVEVYYYDTEAITDQLVYPVGGWTPDVEVLNVNAGESVEYVIQLGASLSSFQDPVMGTFVAEDYESSSVYTVVADDGFPVDPAEWREFGGVVSFTLNPDTTTMTVKLTGATDIPTVNATVSKAFSVALASDTSGNRYSTLRIVGTGVRFSSTKMAFPTGLSSQQTGTDVGVTIDNPFLNDIPSVSRAGVEAAKAYTGLSPSLSGSVTRMFGPTSGSPVFGNVAGARIWNEQTRRWYRVRSASITPSGISFSTVDDDLIYSDVQSVYSGMTYAQVEALNAGLTYEEVEVSGAHL